MKVEQTTWVERRGWNPPIPAGSRINANLALIFAEGNLLCNESLIETVRNSYPDAALLGCSTAGEIYDTSVSDGTLGVTAVEFSGTRFQIESVHLENPHDSFRAGEALARSLNHKDLVHVFVLSKGLNINGSELVRGLMQQLPEGVRVTGGLSGDGARFQKTWVRWNEKVCDDMVVAVGFYGNRLKVGYGSLGGWDTFGPERLITRSKGNVLYELDGKSALALYKHYLGDHAKDLPASGLLFPLSIRSSANETGVVRTILSVNEKDQSLIFAGSVPEGAYARLMKANFDRLIDGAIGAARTSYEALGTGSPDLAILISCVGRKMVLKQRIEEEVEGVREVVGSRTAMTGFYSYGEISPFTPNARCELHNQTMTITTFAEESGGMESP